MVQFYHNKLGHMAGNNYGQNIRQASLTGFGLTIEALPDATLLHHALYADIWRDWSLEVRELGDASGHEGEPEECVLLRTEPQVALYIEDQKAKL
eukprot:SAG31_NODE_14202_length_821_cov_0.871191_1_plen_95_part_00